MSAPAALASLREFARERPAVERCDLCSVAVGPVHDHLLQPRERALKCACAACSLLFPADAGQPWRRVRPKAERLWDLKLPDALWAELHLPIDLAFFQRSNVAGAPLAFFPSPAGATQALLPPEAFEQLLIENPSLRTLEEDVEALLANRVGEAREYYRVSVDVCFALVGLIRSTWRGLSGGTAAWAAIHSFFERLKEARSA